MFRLLLEAIVVGTSLTHNMLIKIPGVPEKITFDGSTKPVAQYIQGVYKYAVGTVGIVAAIVLMYGGVIWLTAGGNSSRVDEAKSWIGAALTGLVLTMTSYLLLSTINPELVDFTIHKVPAVEKLADGDSQLGCCMKDAVCDNTKKEDCEGSFTAGSECNKALNVCQQTDKGGCCGLKAQSWNTDYSFCTDVASAGDCTESNSTYHKNQSCSAVSKCHPSDCSQASDGDECGSNGYCYSGTCLFGEGGPNEPCGNDPGAKCYDGVWANPCPGSLSWDQKGGRPCTSGYYCCY
jgi:hypothetical protein